MVQEGFGGSAGKAGIGSVWNRLAKKGASAASGAERARAGAAGGSKRARGRGAACGAGQLAGRGVERRGLRVGAERRGATGFVRR